MAFPLLAIASFAAVDATLSSGSISSVSVTPLTVDVTGLVSGETVLVERYTDLDGDSLVGAGDLLVQSSTLTDGAVFSIGGVRNIHVPGDEDGVANGQISAHFAIASGPEVGRVASPQLIRISSPTSSFPPLTRTLTVTNPAQAQAITGTVASGGVPVPGAGVILLQAEDDDGEFVLGGQADINGSFSIPAPPGDYIVFAVSPGYVADLSETSASLTSGVNTIADVSLIAATRTLSGKIADADTAAGLPGVQLFIGSEDNLVALASTDSAGNYSVAVTADAWEVEVGETSLIPLGYLAVDSPIFGDTTAGNATGVDASFSKVNALVAGHVTDTEDAPVAGVRVFAGIDGLNTHGDITTDDAGYYVAPLVAGLVHIGVNNDDLVGYVASGGESLTLAAGEAATRDFILEAVTAHLEGTVVTVDDTPVAGIRLSAYKHEANQNAVVVTGTDGTFDLGVTAGSWTLQLETSSAAEFNVLGSSIDQTLVDGQTVAGIEIVVATVTAQIDGVVRDSSLQPLANVNVHGTALVDGVSFTSNTETDGTGYYQLPVINGTWEVGVFSPDSGNAPSQNTVIAGSNQTLNFTLSNAPVIQTHPTDEVVSPGQTFVFSIGLSSSDPVTYQWQVSTDGGGTWTDLTEAAPYSTVTSNVLNVTANSGLNGYRYRCVVASIAHPSETATSNAATLTILTTFAAFQSQYFTIGEQADDAVSGPSADPDADGLVNLLEFAFNLHPKVADANAQPVVGRSSNHLTLTYVRRTDVSLNYIVEVSGDLGPWQAGGGFTEEVSTTPIDDQTESVTVRDLSLISGNSRRFMRLHVYVP